MFGNIFEIHEVSLEIYVEDKLVQRQTMQAPKEILILNFIQTINEIGNDQRPMKIKIIRPEIIWDNFEQRQRVLNNEVVFSNNAMVNWEDLSSNKEVCKNEDIKE